jgi:hypothetical protein
LTQQFHCCFLLSKWFINGKWTYSLSVYKNEFWAKYPHNILDHSLLTYIRRIVNRFLTTGTVSKVNSSGRPPRSDEIVEDLRESERDCC